MRALVSARADGGEYIQAAASRQRFAALSRLTGGVHLTVETAEQLLQAIDDTKSTQPVTRDIAFATAPIWLFLLLIFACAEWVLRRRLSLP